MNHTKGTGLVPPDSEANSDSSSKPKATPSPLRTVLTKLKATYAQFPEAVLPTDPDIIEAETAIKTLIQERVIGEDEPNVYHGASYRNSLRSDQRQVTEDL